MKLRITLTAVAVGALGIGAPHAMAVRPLPTYTATTLDSPEPEAGAEFGNFMDAVGDIDKDGVNDFAVASENQSSGTDSKIGRVWIFSGRTRDVIRTVQNPDPQPGKGFGNSVIGIGDVSGDGVGDLAIAGAALDVYVGRDSAGAPNTKACGSAEPNGCNESQGRVYVFSGRTGSLIRRINDPTPQSNVFFGYGFAIATGDVNGDGVRDFVETAGNENINVPCDANQDGPGFVPTSPCPSVGAAYAFSGKDGSLIHRFTYPGPLEGYTSFGGGGTSNPGDVTGDEVDDLVLGASGASSGGNAYLFDGRTGLLVRPLVDPDPPSSDAGSGVGFGYGLSSGVGPGDVNGDGVRDLYVVAPGQDVAGVSNAGRAYLLNGKDGTLIRRLDDPALQPSGSFGFFYASAGDINDDGTPDVVASRFIFPSRAYAPVAPPGAAAYVFDGRTGAALVTLPGMTRDGPGSSLISPGDLNADGYPDYLLGGRLLDSGAGANSGRVIVELSKAPPAASPPGVTPPPGGVTPPPGVTPPAVKPPVVVAKAARVSVAGFTARVSPARDRRAPYGFTVSGEVRRPAGIDASACKGGRVSVQTKVGTKTISTRRVMLKSNCTYRVAVTFAIRRRLGRGRLTLRVRFLGNDRFKPAPARTLSARAG